MTELAFPPRPTCHLKDMQASRFPSFQAGWYPAEEEPLNKRGLMNRFYRRCAYCGSIHPGDLVKALEAGEIRNSERADMKYGYPHKVYVHLLNPWRGQKRVVSYRIGDDGEPYDQKWGVIPDYDMVKFYTQHLYDEGYCAEALQKTLDALKFQSSNIQDIVREPGEGGASHKFRFVFKPWERPEYMRHQEEE